MQNHILQLLQQHGFVVEESGAELACSPDLSPIKNIGASLTKNTSKKTTNSSAAGNLYQARMGPNSNTKTPETHNLDATTMINMPPSQLF